MLKKYLKRNSKHAAADPVLSTQLNHSTVTTHSAFPHYQDKKNATTARILSKTAPKNQNVIPAIQIW